MESSSKVAGNGQRQSGSPAVHGDAGAIDKVVFFNRWCKKCEVCVSFCPKDALAMGEDDHPYLANPDRCNSCGLCEVLCPDFAITVTQKKGR